MDRRAVARPFGGAALHCRPVTYCLILVALCALVGCERIERPDTDRPSNPPDVAPELSPIDPSEAFPQAVDPADLHSYAKAVAAGAWWAGAGWHSNVPKPVLTQVDIVAEEVHSNTLVPCKDVHLLVARMDEAAWKRDGAVLMLFEPCHVKSDQTDVPFAYRPILVMDGSYKLEIVSGLRYDVIDLGTDTPRFALRVTDEQVAMSIRRLVTHIFLLDDDKWAWSPRMREVFRELTTRESVPWGDATWTDTQIEFRDGGREMKDIVITAHVTKWHGNPDWSKPKHEHENPDYYQTIDEDRTWVFTWDGERYVGEIDVDEH